MTSTYSRDNLASLPTDDDTLSTTFASPGDYNAVALNDGTTVDQSGTEGYALFNWEETATGNNGTFTWKGESTKAPSESKVQIQIYKRTGTGAPVWEDVPDASNNSEDADTNFTISGTVSDLTNYKEDITNKVVLRTWQAVSGGTIPGDAIVLLNTLTTFNGSSDHQTVDTTAIEAGWTGQFSIAAWFNPSGYQANSGYPDYGSASIVDCDGSGYGELHSINLSGSSGLYSAAFNWDGSIDAGNRAAISSVSSPGLGTPHVLVCTYDQANFRMYVDGVEDAASPVARSFAAYMPESMEIGKIANVAFGGYFYGTISRVLWYDRALTPTEVANLPSAGA